VEVAREYGVTVPPLDIHVDSDVPIGVGLSSSAALEVAMLRALRELLRFEADDVQLARLAQRAEIDYAGVNVGILDHMASSLLDDSSMLFLDTRSLDYSLLPLPADTEVLIVDSGASRALASSAYNERRTECEEAARLLGISSLRDLHDPRGLDTLPEPLRRRARHVMTENARVLRALDASAEMFGGLMSASHVSLAENYEVSTPELDALAALLQQERNVYGAKLTGAGFGGACVALCQEGAAAQAGRRVVENYNSAGHRGRVLIPAPSA
jgi:galactokinase